MTNKTITLDLSNSSSKPLMSSLKKHLPRIQSKYPEFEFKMINADNLSEAQSIEYENFLLEKSLSKLFIFFLLFF